ncbi:hypothetical protein R7F09_01865 [Vibrio sp. Vb2532]|uniref:hypothetical protein n=1 Tax=Vibrio sp. Vb2532 TaxID=3074666 RepID=UPI00045F360B|nr:hypothetical protein [Vibrio sp. Vb2532]MDW1766109.1 hypothetical protein [Vibrio sp. Vb2532]GAK19357.1 hypothetical protein JCM19053_1569 [Vibrio sp. JCM 19053]
MDVDSITVACKKADPPPKDITALEVTARLLRWLLDGLNWQNGVAREPLASLEIL